MKNDSSPPINQGRGANYAHPNASFKGAIIFVLTKHIIQKVLSSTYIVLLIVLHKSKVNIFFKYMLHYLHHLKTSFSISYKN